MSAPREALDLKIADSIDRPDWFALCTNPKQEDRACSNLEAWGVECFNPKIQKCQRNSFTGKGTFVTKPLFPRYVFSRFIARTSLHQISFTRGVNRVVSFNGKPVPIDDEVIAYFKARIGENGFLDLNSGEPFKLGDKIRIKSGPWRELVGVVERDLTASERVLVLMTSINYQGRLTVDKDIVEKLS
jgi:transcriptional antiterminator RfaH